MVTTPQPALFSPETATTVDLPGPVFVRRPGWGGQLTNWVSKFLNIRTVPLFLAVLTLVVIANYTLRKEFSVLSTLTKETSQLPTANKSAALNVVQTTTTMTIAAVRGNGPTHLARQAITTYLSGSETAALSAEQKVYAEDWLRRRVTAQTLHPGQTVSFQKEDIRHAIEKAMALKEEQLANLQRYTRP